MLAFLEQIAQEAGLRTPRLVARQVLLTMEGTIASLMVAGDPDILAIAQANLKSILEQAVANSQ